MDDLIRDWTYRPADPPLLIRLSRLKSRWTGRRAFPEWRALVPVTPAQRWNALFLYLPDGGLDAGQRHSLAALGRADGRLMVIAATADHEQVPAELREACDALYWKGLGGYDFSAYAIALAAVAAASPGAALYLQNDSVFGPLADIDALLAHSRWDLTGVLGSAVPEPHLQSYALFLRDVTPARAAALAPVLGTAHAHDRWRDVVNLQETRLARVAADSMTVGALWYQPDAGPPAPDLATALWRKATGQPVSATSTRDPSLVRAVDLVVAGFPFLKRSLVGRNAALQDRGCIDAILAAHGLTVAA